VNTRLLIRLCPPLLTILCMSTYAQTSHLTHLNEEHIGWFSDTSNKSLVLTPARMGQTVDNIPGTITVLERQTLLDRSIATIPEALRLVPGMSVLEVTGFSQSSGHDYRIGYHGGSALVPRRLQVLVDGMSVYLGGLSKIDWTQLPVLVRDIERIEITRNPSAASHGANSFQAVVNIISRHPGDAPKHELSLETHSAGRHLARYQWATEYGPTHYAINASRISDSGYDVAETNVDGADTAEGSRDDAHIQRISIRGHTSLNAANELSLILGVVNGDYESEYVVADQVDGTFPDIEIDDRYINLQTRHTHSPSAESKLRSYYKTSKLTQGFQACTTTLLALPESLALVEANPAYFASVASGVSPSGGSPEDSIITAYRNTRPDHSCLRCTQSKLYRQPWPYCTRTPQNY